ncbi:MAG: hypothetical protein ACLPH3_16420 [Terracidiphilus sp.]
MGQQTLDALAYLVALGAQRTDFLFHLVREGGLFRELRFGLGGAFLGCGSGQALSFDQFNGANDALFKRRKIIGAQGKCCSFTMGRNGVLCSPGVFCNVGFKECLRHKNNLRAFALRASIAP